MREFGNDYKTLAEMLGNKNEAQIKQYVLANIDKFKDVIAEYEHEHGIKESMEALGWVMQVFGWSGK